MNDEAIKRTSEEVRRSTTSLLEDIDWMTERINSIESESKMQVAIMARDRRKLLLAANKHNHVPLTKLSKVSGISRSAMPREILLAQYEQQWDDGNE